MGIIWNDALSLLTICIHGYYQRYPFKLCTGNLFLKGFKKWHSFFFFPVFISATNSSNSSEYSLTNTGCKLTCIPSIEPLFILHFLIVSNITKLSIVNLPFFAKCVSCTVKIDELEYLILFLRSLSLYLRPAAFVVSNPTLDCFTNSLLCLFLLFLGNFLHFFGPFFLGL